MLSIGQYLNYFVATFVVCYVVFVVFLKYLLPRKLKSDNRLQKRLILDEARRNVELFKEKEKDSLESDISTAMEELEQDIELKTASLQAREEELNQDEESFIQEEQRINKLEITVNVEQQLVDRLKNSYKTLVAETQDLRKNICNKLAVITGDNVVELKKNLKSRLIEDACLESSKTLRYMDSELDSSSKKNSLRILNSIVSRVDLNVVSSKNINHSEVNDVSIKEVVSLEDNEIFKILKELAPTIGIETSVDPMSKSSVVKFSGGYGIEREAARLSFEVLLKKGLKERNRLNVIFNDIKKNLERQSFNLGKKAADKLGIKDLHPELLMMVGALNWRTSYRQNQYIHSLEVATLSGIVAGELNLDVDILKRCGLLHDIGKGLDYKIEGSHALISADYADRYGESKTVCDVILAHHSDIVLETPEAYALITADTLSGARPGSRVNIEEGYQERLTALYDVVKSFPEVSKVEIMYGAREVHVEVNHKNVSENSIENLMERIVKKIEEEVSYPGQIKVILTRRFEVSSVA